MMKKILLLFLMTPLFLQAQITSTFDTDADGWTFTSVSTSIPVTYQPAGYVSVTYSSNASATVQNWIAPVKFRGNQLVRSLGMQLKFDLQQSQAGTGAGFDVLIRNGSNFIYLSGITPKPAVAPAWTSYSFTLDETGGWFHSPGAVAATRAQIKSILANVTSIEIRGTYATNAAYTSGLDNVILEQRALAIAPMATSLSVSSGKPGDVITISGSGFDATPANNSIWFGAFAGTKAVVQSATSTQLTVVVPQGAVYGPITIANTVTGLSAKTLTPFNPVFDGGGRIIPASFHNRFTISTIPIEGWFVGDVDGDGWEDFAVTNNNTEDAIDIYRNLALGGDLSTASFAAKVTVPMPPLGGSGANATGLWFVDLDGDGKLDMVSSTHTSAFSAAFVTFRNISTPGNITFEVPEYWAGLTDETPPYFVGDIDGDGRPDLVGGEGSSGAGINLWIAQNISVGGNIEFGPSVGYFSATVDGLSSVAMGDLNNDGKPDMIASWFFGDRFSIIQNNSVPGSFSMTDVGQILTGQYNSSMRIVDVNLDGKNDLMWKRTGGGIYIRINTDTDGLLTDTDFATEFILTSDLGANGGISIVDFNGDGKPDIASTDDSDVGVYENVFSGGAFSVNAYIPAYQVLGTGGNSSGPAVVDFNHDGKPDFAMATGSSINIIQNKNVVGPQISVNTVSPLSAPVGATITITGNNFSTTASENEVYFGAVKATILSATATQITATVPAGASYAPVSVRRGELTSRYRLPFITTFSSGVTFNSTHFAPPVNFTLTNANYDIEVGDLNRDGKPDLLAEANGGFVFRNTHTSGAINNSSLIPDDTLSVNSFINPRLEDFDGDGFIDVASVNGLAHRNISTPTEITFQPSITIALGGSEMHTADFNNDGKTDIAVTVDLSGPGDLVIKENRSIVGSFTTGTFGSFSTNIVFNKPAAGGGIASEDFDGDGFADIATTNPLSDNISVYRNAGVLKISNAQFASRTDLAVGDNPGRIYKGDFDADGKVDLLLYHGTGANTTLLTVFHNTSTSGNLSFTRIDLTNPSATTVATIADLDGDGKPEIITTSESGNRFSIFKNVHTTGALTTASFATPFNTTVTAPRGIATGDLNLDGKPEIIITRAAGLLVVYENLIPDVVINIIQQPVTSLNACLGASATLTTDANGAINMSYQWQKLNTITSLFENLVNDATYAGVTTKTLSITTVSNVPSGDYRCLIKGDFAPDVTTTTTTLVVNNLPSPPTVTPAARCDTGTITLTANGGTNGNYRWYTTASGGLPITGEVNGALVIPSLATTTTYYVSLVNAFCESDRTALTATVNNSPAAPTITVTGTPTFCIGQTVTLEAPTGFSSYLWSTGATTQQITANATGSFTVIVTDAAGCSSPASNGVTVNAIVCNTNQPPSIATVPLTTAIGGLITFDVSALLSDPDNNLDLSTLKVVNQPQSGALAQISANNLVIDYNGVAFSGTDKLTVEVCDLTGSCTQQELTIEVVGDIVVYNALSPNGDGLNDVFIIQYINSIEETSKNKVTIYNRWGDEVFSIKDYDNDQKVFAGLTNSGKALPTGTYFYKIEFNSARSVKNGYLYLKR